MEKAAKKQTAKKQQKQRGKWQSFLFSFSVFLHFFLFIRVVFLVERPTDASHLLPLVILPTTTPNTSPSPAHTHCQCLSSN
jgi:hypothetical protein